MAEHIENNLLDYFFRKKSVLSALPVNQIKTLISTILATSSLDRTIFLVGNGGSASTASHFATDLGVGLLKKGSLNRVISLCDNSSVITATANDISYDVIFSKQLELLGKSGDLLVLISASGNSMNLIESCKVAKTLGLQVFSMTGFDGGMLRSLTPESNIHIETPMGWYGIVEDMHLSICHAITECIGLE